MDSIKIFIKVFWQRSKDQWLLSIIALASLWGSIQTSIPSLFIEVEWSEETAKGITTIVQGLSFSFFAAWLFYIFQDVVPQVQKRIDAIRLFNKAVCSINDQLKHIEASIFLANKQVPTAYTAEDMYESSVDAIMPPDDGLKDWGILKQIPITVHLKLMFTITVHSYIKVISSELSSLQNVENLLTPFESAVISKIRGNKFLTFFGIEKKDNYHIDAGDKQQLIKVFDDFIQLRKRVKAEIPKLQTI